MPPSRYEYRLEEQSTLEVIVGYTRNKYFLVGIVVFGIFMFSTDASFLFEAILGSKGKSGSGHLPNSLLTIDYPYTMLKRVVMDQPVESSDVPFFWHPHKSDERLVQQVLTTCYGIEVVALDSLDSIKKAREVKLSGRKATNFAISSPFARKAIEVFSPEHKGRMSCFFRHPLDYDFHDALSDITHADNWLVRYLLDIPTGPLGYRQLGIAKKIVRDVCVVATIDKMEESIKRMADYYGWQLQASDTCVDEIVAAENPEEKYADHDTPEWQEFYQTNRYDCQLYELAQSTWRAQIQTIVPLTTQVERFSGVKQEVQRGGGH